MPENDNYDDTEALFLLARFVEPFAPDYDGANKAGKALLAALVRLGETISKAKIEYWRSDATGQPDENVVVFAIVGSVVNVGVHVVHEGHSRFKIRETRQAITGLQFNPATGLIEGPDEEPLEGKLFETVRRVPIRRSALAVMVEQITKTIVELARR